ncbi:hypothetical protein ESCO_004184 [Escovopsis weberi]|uniref:Uncharacterized protein n=1 Tax=Escovopsis weberi TaxID=150374 RepID=A0A0M8N0X1_ESCWE|nr:hypothetical protein ESCO_004184 [Escovopsis weberi]
MTNEPNDNGVVQDYIEDHLPVGFYTNAPSNAKAIFSTGRGERPFRAMEHILPLRKLHLWSKDEIQAVCNSLRKSFWEDMKRMQQPFCWDDLWHYFDAYDLYHYGSLNLWNVINTLFDENRIIAADYKKEMALHIGMWADEWLQKEVNRQKLLQWDAAQGTMILFILDEEDRLSLGPLEDDAIPLQMTKPFFTTAAFRRLLRPRLITNFWSR